jgi:hypothetical protein
MTGFAGHGATGSFLAVDPEPAHGYPERSAGKPGAPPLGRCRAKAPVNEKAAQVFAHLCGFLLDVEVGNPLPSQPLWDMPCPLVTPCRVSGCHLRSTGPSPLGVVRISAYTTRPNPGLAVRAPRAFPMAVILSVLPG